MCIHYKYIRFSCNCVEPLPAGGPGYLPPRLCDPVTDIFNFYHGQPRRLPVPESAPTAKACNIELDAGPVTGILATINKFEPCVTHQGLKRLNDKSWETTVDLFLQAHLDGANAMDMQWSIYEWRETTLEYFDEEEAYAASFGYSGQDGELHGVERIEIDKIWGFQIAAYPEVFVKLTEIGYVSPRTFRGGYKLKHLQPGYKSRHKDHFLPATSSGPYYITISPPFCSLVPIAREDVPADVLAEGDKKILEHQLSRVCPNATISHTDANVKGSEVANNQPPTPTATSGCHQCEEGRRRSDSDTTSIKDGQGHYSPSSDDMAISDIPSLVSDSGSTSEEQDLWQGTVFTPTNTPFAVESTGPLPLAARFRLRRHSY